MFFLKYVGLALGVGVLAGTASAAFLVTLDWVTNVREANVWIIACLPLGGLAIGWMYHAWGTSVVKGNNLLIDEFHQPKEIIPLRMAPLVLSGTLITHLFGGSAGREGTAVQMGGALADQFSRLFRLDAHARKIVIIMGVSAGFASVFGTPLAGAVFALEFLVLGKMRYEAIVPSFLAAVIGNEVCHAWGVPHTYYSIPEVPAMTLVTFGWTLAVGVLFGLTALAFARSNHFWGDCFKRWISFPPLRPFAGGIAIALAVWTVGTTDYIGLGIPFIVDSFSEPQAAYAFALKLLFTTFTLGAGFKGGEVTPLFFIGAALGNALVWIVPLPLALLAGMGFVAVFAGATNTPLASTLMGIELFGSEAGVYLALACVVAYLFSGHNGIYASQVIGSRKHGNGGRPRESALP